MSRRTFGSRAEGARRSPRTDAALGIKANRPVEVDALALPPHRQADAHRYEATSFGVLDDILVGLGVRYAEYVFVDLGAGKGRIVCLAAGLPFKRVVGVELSPRLVEVARANVRSLTSTWRRATQVDIVEGDAGEFDFPRGPVLIYLFNPFGPNVLSRVLDRLEVAHLENPVPRYLLYYMPAYTDVLQRRSFLRPIDAGRDWATFATAEA
ncbi:MAG: class I SAM-dependent methyltransferase [Deltaproteobacteria bacterium]|nr:class I SAM-dependent methyltransferase [Deltaproteobacteria bacterium]